MNRNDYIANTWIRAKPGEIDQLPEEIEPGASAYRLVGRRVVPCDITEWAGYFSVTNEAGLNKRVVARNEFFGGEVAVSTVFLGLNHDWGGGPPLLFETMIFGGSHADEQWRCSTYAQAEEQHKKALELLGLI